MAGEDDTDGFSQEELDALDQEDAGEEVDDPEGDEADEDAAGLDAGDEESEEGGQDQARQAQGQDGPVKGRASGRIARLSKELKESRAEAAQIRRDYEARLAALEGGSRQQQQLDPRLEADRLAAMTPEERVEERLQRTEERHQQELMRMQFQQADRDDKAEYKRRATTDKRAARYEQDVETLLGQLRQTGMNPKRETIYFYLLGQKVANAKPAKRAQQAAGEERLRRQQTRPANAGSDTTGKRGGKTLAQRLEGVPL